MNCLQLYKGLLILHRLLLSTFIFGGVCATVGSRRSGRIGGARRSTGSFAALEDTHQEVRSEIIEQSAAGNDFEKDENDDIDGF